MLSLAMNPNNTNPDEIDKFTRLARDWWDPKGKLRTLHDVNPLRLGYIDKRITLKGKNVLDVGCGGGILTEAMAHKGANVSGLDASHAVIQVAVEHARKNALDIHYMTDTVEALADRGESRFDVITCMELLEHVPRPDWLIRSCAKLLNHNGHLILASINRNMQSYLLGILGAEYILGLLPKGTHDYARFIRPSELGRWLRDADFSVLDISGMRYLPGIQYCALISDPAVNYLLHARLAD